jgi:hypothetical protein
MVQSCKDQDGARTLAVLDQLHEISSPVLMTSRRRDVTRGIHPMFAYQSTSSNYYEPMEHGRWMKTPMLMCLRRLKFFIKNHLNMQRHK